MANEIGNVTGITGSSMALNTQRDQGAVKPKPQGNHNPGGTKPEMAIFGHYHKAEYIPMYRNVAIIQTGCIQAQTPFMRRFHISAHVGGWIVEVIIKDRKDLVNRVKAEFVSFYEEQA